MSETPGLLLTPPSTHTSYRLSHFTARRWIQTSDPVSHSSSISVSTDGANTKSEALITNQLAPQIPSSWKLWDVDWIGQQLCVDVLLSALPSFSQSFREKWERKCDLTWMQKEMDELWPQFSNYLCDNLVLRALKITSESVRAPHLNVNKTAQENLTVTVFIWELRGNDAVKRP